MSNTKVRGKVGEIIDGYWEIIDTYYTDENRNIAYKVKNTYNGMIIEISHKAYKNIIKDKSGVSKSMCRRIRSKNKKERTWKW